MAKHMDFGKSVVAALDFGGDWENVLEHAASFARGFGLPLHLMSVVEEHPTALRHALDAKELQAYTAREWEHLTERLGTAATTVAKRGIQVETSIRSGKPFKEVLHVAKKEGAGIIVCGAGVTEGSDWLFVGTTPDRLLRLSDVPVLIVGPGRPSKIRRILVPTDFDRQGEGALRVAARIARDHRARVSVLHVYAIPSLLHLRMGDVASLRRRAKEAAFKAMDEFVADSLLAAEEKPPHRLLKASVDTVNAAGAIVGEAARLKMDLIVMALGGRTILEHVFIGSVAEKVIRLLPCNLLALPVAWAKKR